MTVTDTPTYDRLAFELGEPTVEDYSIKAVIWRSDAEALACEACREGACELCEDTGKTAAGCECARSTHGPNGIGVGE